MSTRDINLVAGEDAVLLLHGLASSLPMNHIYLAMRLSGRVKRNLRSTGAWDVQSTAVSRSA